MILIISVMTVCSLKSQTFKTLQSMPWYCVGNWGTHKHIMMTSAAEHAKYDTEVRFLKSGKLYRKSASLNDSSYTYVYKRAMFRIERPADPKEEGAETVLYYRLNTLQHGKTYELIPITEADYNKPAEE